jgi:hypothetical protein
LSKKDNEDTSRLSSALAVANGLTEKILWNSFRISP